MAIPLGCKFLGGPEPAPLCPQSVAEPELGQVEQSHSRAAVSKGVGLESSALVVTSHVQPAEKHSTNAKRSV